MLFDLIFNNRLVKLGGVAAACAALVGCFVHEQRNFGRRDMGQKVEKANEDVAKKAAVAAGKSRDPTARGVLNPYYRAD